VNDRNWLPLGEKFFALLVRARYATTNPEFRALLVEAGVPSARLKPFNITECVKRLAADPSHLDAVERYALLCDFVHHNLSSATTAPSGVRFGDTAYTGSGRIVVNGLEESLARVLHMGCWSEVRSFGAAVSDFTAAGEPHEFDVLYQGQPVGHVKWALTGVHNQLNALAAIAAAQHVGVSPEVAASALGRFENVKRRMEVRGTVARTGGSITVYDDFAHHPTAIRTTVDGLRRKVGPGARILAVFEPRSNTMKLGVMKAQLPWSLEDADLAFCHGGGLDWDARDALAGMGDKAQVADTIDELVAQVVAQARAGDHILCMSNGGFGGVHLKLLQALQNK